MHCNTEYLHHMIVGDSADCESVNVFGVHYCEQKGFVLLFVEFWILPLYSTLVVGSFVQGSTYSVT